MKRKPIVSVEWLDAHGSVTAELEEHELPSEPARYTTHGLLVKDCPAGVVVASDETPNRTYRGWTFIPRGMIVTIKYVEKPRGVQQRREKQRREAEIRPDSSPGPAAGGDPHGRGGEGARGQ